MSITINESGITFGPYAESVCFQIEKSPIYTHLGKDVKMVEFVLNRLTAGGEQVFCLVEAKQSSPKPDNLTDFSTFISEISEKMIHGISLLLAILLNRHGSSEEILPESMRSVDLSRCKARYILVINGHKEEWLPPIQDALRKSLRSMDTTWNFGPNTVVVLNDEKAAEYSFLHPTRRTEAGDGYS